MKLSLIMPVLNEAVTLDKVLDSLQVYRDMGVELILVDGGSDDNTREVSAARVDRLIRSAKGRARQMNAGAAVARGDVFLFLHADTDLPLAAYHELLHAYSNEKTVWSRFNVCLSGHHFLFRLIAFLMNLRSRLSGVATGDQALAIRRAVFIQLGGYADIPLMEDIEISTRLKKISRPVCLHEHVTTSSRRWEQGGIMRTILLMWCLRLSYFFGVSPVRLAARYYTAAREKQHD